MKCLARNKQTLYYALVSSQTEIVDEYGNATGELNTTYTTPTQARMNVSPARGTVDVEQFGINANYTKTLVTDDMNCPIDESAILWIGTSTSAPYNYKVTQVARSLNSITYAVKEVNVSNGKNN